MSKVTLSMGVENGTFEEEMSILSGNEEEPPSLPIQNGSTARRRNNLRFQGETASSDAPSYVLKGRMKDLYENNPNLFFDDGLRKIDFVLVWEQNLKVEGAEERRRIFEEELELEGLELERKFSSSSHQLVKIHAPIVIIERYAELLKMRLPMKPDWRRSTMMQDNGFHRYLKKIPGFSQLHTATTEVVHQVKSRWEWILDKFKMDPDTFKPEKKFRLHSTYTREKKELFDVSDQFMLPSLRSRVVDFILNRKKFSNDPNDHFAFGIERLIEEKAYSAAYPLHDGDSRTPGNIRYKLARHWASLWKAVKYQPLDHIKEYFGVKIGLYFAWLGFYTHTLIFASVVGLFCFFYGLATLDNNIPSQEICDLSKSVTMCPVCDKFCDYWDLSETCLHSKVTYLFDNSSTVFFAIFMSFWAALFLELWKRYSAKITHRWDLTGFDAREEHPRPQYLAKLKDVQEKKYNPLTHKEEPRVPFWRMKFPNQMISYTTILLLILLVIALVVGVIIYRICVLSVLAIKASEEDSLITRNAQIFTTATAASLNLVCIMLFNRLYERAAYKLTEMELPRTQTDFEDSYTVKIYLLQFVNLYASIFYIGFIKGKMIGRPGKYNKIFGFRQEECAPGGCMLELTIQLAIIMVGKQAMGTCMEMIQPILMKWWNTMRLHAAYGSIKKKKDEKPQWLKDYTLNSFGPEGLFGEYLEMVLQYGFVTIFVAAFPLAPLFALLNNLFEMRLDAKKVLNLYRRPVAQRVRNIGVWYTIMDMVGKFSVITNAFIIAFTSDFIPQAVYYYYYSPKIYNYSTMTGYVNHTLSWFDVNDFMENKPDKPGVEYCRYFEYRSPPWADPKYKRTQVYWHVMAARLAFIVVFENIVALVVFLVQYCIPDMPRQLQDQIQAESYLTNEIIIDHELTRSRNRHNGCTTPEPLIETQGTEEERPVVNYRDDLIYYNEKRGVESNQESS
ncbi:anoctamin-4-like isoform X2 [Artemia franciscana]|uniref:Anoctamin n=1 Tax=Artemia franciscana TaxID=6661 RepID=A0AA88I103_ARTSF|nr:hypothetical protein QYM36_010629 [Artemia franciscana]